jgi:gas vesicle protein
MVNTDPLRIKESNTFMKEKGKLKIFFIGLVAGGAAGSVFALLFAPKSGKELRGDISARKDKLAHDTNELLLNARKHASDLIENSKKKAGLLVDDMKRKIHDVKENSEELINSGKDIITDKSSKIKEAVKSGIDAYKEERKLAK